MLHAAAMFVGLMVVWLLLVPEWREPEDLAIAGAAALACAVIGARLGGFGRGGAFSHAPQLAILASSRVGAVIGGALATIRAALDPDMTLRPALVRVKARASSDFARAVLAEMIGAAPGATVVETDADGLLVHVLDEESLDATNLGLLEARVVSTLDGKAML